jgi:S1-C subfamily serine protease
MPKHHNVLYTLIFILVVIHLATFIVFSSNFAKMQSQLEKYNKDSQKSIRESENFTLQVINAYESKNQLNFLEVSKAINKLNEAIKNLSSQQSSVKEDIVNLKSSKGDFTGVVQQSIQGVVSIATDKSIGTGFVVHDSGIIVTNLHVLQGGTRLAVFTYDNKVLVADYIGGDTLRDIALLKIQEDYPALPIANSDNVKVGSKVIAIGNPLGLSFTVTEGIVSGVDRKGANNLSEYIQTDVSLNPGNSGGPLLDTSGRVIGINNFKLGGAESLGFALESNAMKETINNLLNTTLL